MYVNFSYSLYIVKQSIETLYVGISKEISTSCMYWFSSWIMSRVFHHFYSNCTAHMMQYTVNIISVIYERVNPKMTRPIFHDSLIIIKQCNTCRSRTMQFLTLLYGIRVLRDLSLSKHYEQHHYIENLTLYLLYDYYDWWFIYICTHKD